MGEAALKERVSDLEQMMMQLTYQSMKTDMAVQELANEMKEFKNEMKEFKNEMKEFKNEMKEFKNEMGEFKDEMREFKNEMTRYRIESEADRKRRNKEWGELANKMGTIVEDIVAPGVNGVARQYFGIEEFDSFAVRYRKISPDRTQRREFDVVAETSDLIFIVETKATPRTEYIREFISLIPELNMWFPVIGEKKLIPIFASLNILDDQVAYLSKNNILAMGMRDDGMDLYNPDVREYLK
ncbi:conserved hypothetical protein [Desulfamplus magnetovallimortis]|uniref:Uncharacterized protein n=1 Tax=Desulfamplus magnetovallimortis TaxID=1246637 RepID=A0A1W1HLF3_9BACT|nr:hypothetical protein [Desulfamplus magnetovallimortis]SLM33178.1 conserved hypothetical protein [Desulfamplus magnetovallimortis]